jgi:hypothetical protein
MSTTPSVPSSGKIYKGIQFSPDQGNYHEWLESSYNNLKWNLLHRHAIPLEEGKLEVKRPKPSGPKVTEAEKEA